MAFNERTRFSMDELAQSLQGEELQGEELAERAQYLYDQVVARFGARPATGIGVRTNDYADGSRFAKVDSVAGIAFIVRTKPTRPAIVHYEPTFYIVDLATHKTVVKNNLPVIGFAIGLIATTPVQKPRPAGL